MTALLDMDAALLKSELARQADVTRDRAAASLLQRQQQPPRCTAFEWGLGNRQREIAAAASGAVTPVPPPSPRSLLMLALVNDIDAARSGAAALARIIADINSFGQLREGTIRISPEVLRLDALAASVAACSDTLMGGAAWGGCGFDERLGGLGGSSGDVCIITDGFRLSQLVR